MEKSKQQQQQQKKSVQAKSKRKNELLRPPLNKRTSSASNLDDDDDSNMDMDGYVDRNFNDYNDNSADHIGIADEDLSQQPIAKGLPTKFMFRGMRGQRQYDVPQIGKFKSIISSPPPHPQKSIYIRNDLSHLNLYRVPILHDININCILHRN